MRFLIFTFSLNKGVANIGDYIQVMAAERFYNEYAGVKEFVINDRETLNSVKMGGGKCKLICNGWFINHPHNWPPSQDIDPLFVSFHLNDKASNTILSKQENIDYFKQYAPIGCRDENTAQKLRTKVLMLIFQDVSHSH